MNPYYPAVATSLTLYYERLRSMSETTSEPLKLKQPLDKLPWLAADRGHHQYALK
jgi:hypothetical protein